MPRLPNIPQLKATANHTGAGSSVGGAIGGVKIPKSVNPRALFTAPKVAKAPVHQYSPYDQFTQTLPYAPGQIGTLAQGGYDADVANANKLAAMGMPTSDQINQQTATRTGQVQGIADSLRNALAGIQVASVGQGNAGAASLQGQQAQIAAQGNPVASVTGVPNAGVSAPGLAAVLASQVAGTGNLYGGLEAAAASSGAQNAQKSVDLGESNLQANNQGIQRNLASLLSGLAPVSSREGTMTSANTGVTSANIATRLTVYQNLVNAKAQAQAEGDKVAEAAADRELKQWLAQQSDATRVKVAGITQAGQTTRAKLKKTSSGSGGTTSASQRRSELQSALKIINTAGGTTTKSTTPQTYTVKIQAVTASGKPNPLAAPTSVTIPAADVATWKPPKGYQALGKPALAKSTTTSKTINKPGSYTKYNRAASYLKNLGWSQAEIKAALKQYHP